MNEISAVTVIDAILECGNEKNAAVKLGCSVTYLYRFIPSGPSVYFIEAAGLVKVGTASGGNIVNRLKTIKTTNAANTKIIGLTNGGKDVEKILHDKWKQYRHHGEWFILSDEIRSYLEGLTYANG